MPDLGESLWQSEPDDVGFSMADVHARARSVTRRRRRVQTVVAGVLVLGLIGVGTLVLRPSADVLLDSGPTVSVPPVEEREPDGIWLSNPQISSAGQPVLLAVVSPDQQAQMGTVTGLERWDGHAWVAQATLVTRTEVGGGSGGVLEVPSELQLQPGGPDVGGPDVSGASPTAPAPSQSPSEQSAAEEAPSSLSFTTGENGIGPLERVALPPLEPSWYRVVKTTSLGARHGAFEVVNDGDPVAPVLDAEGPSLSLEPDTLSTTGAEILDHPDALYLGPPAEFESVSPLASATALSGPRAGESTPLRVVPQPPGLPPPGADPGPERLYSIVMTRSLETGLWRIDVTAGRQPLGHAYLAIINPTDHVRDGINSIIPAACMRVTADSRRGETEVPVGVGIQTAIEAGLTGGWELAGPLWQIRYDDPDAVDGTWWTGAAVVRTDQSDATKSVAQSPQPEIAVWVSPDADATYHGPVPTVADLPVAVRESPQDFYLFAANDLAEQSSIWMAEATDPQDSSYARAGLAAGIDDQVATCAASDLPPVQSMPADTPRASASPSDTRSATPVPEPTDGRLDCLGEETWGYTYDYSSDATGEPTAEAALQRDLLERTFLDQIRITRVTGTIVVEGRKVLRATARQFPDGTWLIDSARGCSPETPTEGPIGRLAGSCPTNVDPGPMAPDILVYRGYRYDVTTQTLGREQLGTVLLTTRCRLEDGGWSDGYIRTGDAGRLPTDTTVHEIKGVSRTERLVAQTSGGLVVYTRVGQVPVPATNPLSTPEPGAPVGPIPTADPTPRPSPT